MKKIVIHGIVEHLDERQQEARRGSLHAALQRMTEARATRLSDASAPPMFETEELNERRRRLFGFSLRARRAVDDLM